MGESLLKQLISQTGLPTEGVENELDRLIEKAGLQKENITLDDLRLVLADYLQDILLESKDRYQSLI